MATVVLKGVQLTLAVVWGMLVVQNWQPWVPLVFLGQPLVTLPLGVAFGLASLAGWLTAWGLDKWLGQPPRPPEPEPIVLEPDYVEYPRKPPPPADDEDDWDFTEDWR